MEDHLQNIKNPPMLMSVKTFVGWEVLSIKSASSKLVLSKVIIRVAQTTKSKSRLLKTQAKRASKRQRLGNRLGDRV